MGVEGTLSYFRDIIFKIYFRCVFHITVDFFKYYQNTIFVSLEEKLRDLVYTLLISYYKISKS